MLESNEKTEVEDTQLKKKYYLHAETEYMHHTFWNCFNCKDTNLLYTVHGLNVKTLKFYKHYWNKIAYIIYPVFRITEMIELWGFVNKYQLIYWPLCVEAWQHFLSTNIINMCSHVLLHIADFCISTYCWGRIVGWGPVCVKSLYYMIWLILGKNIFKYVLMFIFSRSGVKITITIRSKEFVA